MAEPGKVEVVPIGSLHGFPGNPRTHDLDTIRASLRYHGQYRTVVARSETRHVLAGNGTWEAARAEGWTDIRVEWVSCSDTDAAKIVAVDNRSNDLAGYDEIALADLLRSVPDLTGTGFDAGAFDRLLADHAANFSEPAAPAPAPEIPHITRLGDRIVLGDHVLVCGDAREEATWKALTAEDDDLATLIWTDPPYGVDLHAIAAARGIDHGEMAGDDIDPGALERLIYVAFGWALEHTADQATFYLCHADTLRPRVQAGLEEAGWAHHQTLVWVKDHLVLGRQDHQWMHEPILYGWKADGTHRWFGDHDKTTVLEGTTRAALEQLQHHELVDALEAMLAGLTGTVIRFARPQVAREHPTAKPIDMVAHHLHNSSQPRDIVLDPFGGSGTTLLAAEQTGRRARLIELEPIYCDVIVARWQELTGHNAMRPTRRKKAAPTP